MSTSRGRWWVSCGLLAAACGGGSDDRSDGVDAASLSGSLTVALTGDGAGVVTSMPSGVDCGATCEAQFLVGTEVTLSATPDGDATFVGWGGACAGDGACVVTLADAGEVAVTAEFRAPRATLTVDVTGAGTVTSTPAGIDCGPSCTLDLEPGAAVTLTPQPARGWLFAGWGGACTDAGLAPCELTLADDASVTATFEPAPCDDFASADSDVVPGWGTRVGANDGWQVLNQELLNDAGESSGADLILRDGTSYVDSCVTFDARYEPSGGLVAAAAVMRYGADGSYLLLGLQAFENDFSTLLILEQPAGISHQLDGLILGSDVRVRACVEGPAASITVDADGDGDFDDASLGADTEVAGPGASGITAPRAFAGQPPRVDDVCFD